MVVNFVFTEAWWPTLLIYAVVFFLARYAVYQLIFNRLVGSPQSMFYRDILFWKRKVSLLGAVIFAPLFEEVLFTYLAYTSFLKYAQPGREWLVIVMVAAFFSILHFPGDVRQQYYSRRGIQPFYLLLWQFNRFYFSLAAYFIFLKTGTLWASIFLHYLVNGLVSIYNFDLEDGSRQGGRFDIIEVSIIILELVIVLFACLQYYDHFPLQGKYLLILGIGAVIRWMYLLFKVQGVAARRFIS